MVEAKKSSKDFSHVKTYAVKVRSQFAYSSEDLAAAPQMYVGWLDLMGAGHLMGTSIHKTANFLARLHMAIGQAITNCNFSGTVIAINDGVFLITPKKQEVMTVLRDAMALLSLFFVAVPRPHDRFFVRSGIAFGPVYFGKDIEAGIKTAKNRTQTTNLSQVAFGPPIIAAYQSESKAPPYGIAIHESARAFAPEGDSPFRMTHWLWWQTQDEIKNPAKGVSLPELKACLLSELLDQFKWMRGSLIFHQLTSAKIDEWEKQCEQYFSLA